MVVWLVVLGNKWIIFVELSLFFVSESVLSWLQCHSESSRSEDMSSDGEEEEEEESPSLSPSSSHSCSRAERSAPQSDSSAPGSLPAEGGGFLSATPAQWSVEEVCRFISSLQGLWSDILQGVISKFGPYLFKLYVLMFICYDFLFRLWGTGCPVSVAGNRRTGSDASARGPPHLYHEHQAGSCSEDLRFHQQPAWVMQSGSPESFYMACLMFSHCI